MPEEIAPFARGRAGTCTQRPRRGGPHRRNASASRAAPADRRCSADRSSCLSALQTALGAYARHRRAKAPPTRGSLLGDREKRLEGLPSMHRPTARPAPECDGLVGPRQKDRAPTLRRRFSDRWRRTPRASGAHAAWLPRTSRRVRASRKARSPATDSCPRQRRRHARRSSRRVHQGRSMRPVNCAPSPPARRVAPAPPRPEPLLHRLRVAPVAARGPSSARRQLSSGIGRG